MQVFPHFISSPYLKASSTGATLTPMLPLIEAFFLCNASPHHKPAESQEVLPTPRLSRFIKFAEIYRYERSKSHSHHFLEN